MTAGADAIRVIATGIVTVITPKTMEACHETTVVCNIDEWWLPKSEREPKPIRRLQTITPSCGSATDCETGYVNNSGNCRVPSANGKYADANDAEKSCPVKPSGATWVSVTGGMTQAEACDFTCPKGEVKTNSGSTRACATPGTGIYSVGGNPHNCWALGSNSAAELTNRGGASGWVNPQPNTVTTATQCQLSGCTANGKVLNASKTACVNLPDRHYKDPATQQAISCGSVHASVSANSANGGGWATNQVGVKSKGDCKIECGSGHHPARSGAGTGEIAQCEQECSLGSTPNFGYAPENSGRIAWDSSKQPNGGWSATCTTVVCNEGYDDNDDDNTCEKTEAGYYSAGQNRKTRTQCSTDGTKNQPIPEDASWQGTGLVSAVACRWTCNSGHHISSDSTSCTINDCSNEINDGNGERTRHNGACQVTSCEAGFYEKTTGSCSEVEAVSGKYSNANDAGTTACSNTVTKPGTATWTNPIKSDDVGDCTWACNDGYARHLNACYVDTRVCDILDSSSTTVGAGSQSYQPGTVGNYTACEVTSCIAGYYKDPNAQACIQVGANLGKYSPANDMNTHDCSTKPTNSDWVMTAGADDSGDCNWDCDGDYTEDDGTCHETTVVCNIESGGTKIGTGTQTYQAASDNYSVCGSATDCETGYVNNSGNLSCSQCQWEVCRFANDAEKSCPAKPGGCNLGFCDRRNDPRHEACDFTCAVGEIKTNSGSTRACATPGTGIYSVGGNPHNCWTSGSDSATELTNRGGASGWVNPQPNTVTTATQCQLSGCTANGKVLNASKTACVNLPDRHYKDPATQQAVSCGSVHASVSANSANGGRLVLPIRSG